MRDTCILVYAETKFPIYKVWWLRDASQIPMWKSRLKTQHGRIPIDPAILAAIGQRFIAKKTQKIKNADTRGLRQRTRRPETGNILLLFCFGCMVTKEMCSAIFLVSIFSY